jgi:hypothetical protein
MPMFEIAVAVLCGLAIACTIAYSFLIRSDAKELADVIPDVWSAYIWELECVLHQDIEQLGDLTSKEKKIAEQERLRLIGRWLLKLEHNILLFLALGHSETAKTGNKPVAAYTAHDMRAREMLSKAILCRFMVAYAQWHFAFLLKMNAVGWPVTRPLVELSLRFCNSLVEKYRRVVILTLDISSAYGNHHYENLFAAL